jgi:hypothetical protein
MNDTLPPGRQDPRLCALPPGESRHVEAQAWRNRSRLVRARCIDAYLPPPRLFIIRHLFTPVDATPLGSSPSHSYHLAKVWRDRRFAASGLSSATMLPELRLVAPRGPQQRGWQDEAR